MVTVSQWEPGTRYDFGAIVEYQGGYCYKIIQPHTSQPDWTPPITPALWGRLAETAPQYDQPKRGDNQDGDEKPWIQQQAQTVDITHEERKKHWYDIDDHRKKQLEIGGGLVAGAALLGAGYYAYHEHQKSEEQKKAQVWGLQNWVGSAQARAEKFHQHGSSAPVTWVLTHGRNIPQGALPGGSENGEPLYIARAFHEGGVQLGKASSRFQEGANIGFGHKEFEFGTFEVLVGNQYAVKWVNVRGHLKPEELGCTLVEGGHEDDGTPLYVAQAEYGGGVHPGKTSTKLDGAYIAYGGTEERVKEYRVLAYA